MTFVPQKPLFGLLLMVYDRVGDEDKFSYESFIFGRPRFHAANHFKIEVKEFFS